MKLQDVLLFVISSTLFRESFQGFLLNKRKITSSQIRANVR